MEELDIIPIDEKRPATKADLKEVKDQIAELKKLILDLRSQMSSSSAKQTKPTPKPIVVARSQGGFITAFDRSNKVGAWFRSEGPSSLSTGDEVDLEGLNMPASKKWAWSPVVDLEVTILELRKYSLRFMVDGNQHTAFIMKHVEIFNYHEIDWASLLEGDSITITIHRKRLKEMKS